MLNILKRKEEYLSETTENIPTVTNNDDTDLINLRRENELYKCAFKQISDVVQKAASGDLSARIVHWDEYGKLSETLSNLNKSYDLTDAFIRESGASLEHAAEGKFYRSFIETGILGDFGNGAHSINAAISRMTELESNRKNEMIALADNLEDEVKSAVDIVQNNSEAMRSKAVNMSSDLETVSSQANEVVSLSNNATQNVESCAAAVEQMSASAQEIFRQVNSSRQCSEKAENELEKTNEIVKDLASAAEEIGDITNMIKDIAARTNLLALNATIEAARAGEFGKGFAVVASEVKTLAKQTSEATDQVESQITTIQQMANGTTDAVESIGVVIHEAGELSQAVATAAEEQLEATQEISRNVQEAAQATRTSASSVTDVVDKTTSSTTVANEVAKESVVVSKATDVLSEKVINILSNLRGFEAFNRRKAERFEPAPSLHCEIKFQDKCSEGEVRNVSRTGAAIDTDLEVIKDKKICFKPKGWSSGLTAIIISNENKVVRISFLPGQENLITELMSEVQA